MKKLEIIRRILKEDNNISIKDLISKNEIENLSILCYYNKKYLTKKNFKILIDNIVTIDAFLKDVDDKDILSTINCSIIAFLISKYPNLFYKIPSELINSFTTTDWAIIITKQPKLLNNCKIINKFELKDWFMILKHQPQLTLYFKNIYNSFNINIDSFNINHNCNLTSLIQKISNYIDVNKINTNENNFYQILINYPNIIEKLNKYNIKKISINTWIDIISIKPDLLKFCPIKKEFNSFITSNNNIQILISLIANQPSFINLLKINKINNYNLFDIIIKQPQLIDKLNINFEGYDVAYWIEILIKQPQFINKCDKIKEIKINEWVNILIKQPSLIKYCNRLDKISSYDLYRIILHHPKLINNNKFNINLSSTYKISLLMFYPELIEKLKVNDIAEAQFRYIIYTSKNYITKTLKKYLKRFHNSELLTNIIGIYPNLKEFYTENNLWQYVDFNQLTENLEYGILK